MQTNNQISITRKTLHGIMFLGIFLSAFGTGQVAAVPNNSTNLAPEFPRQALMVAGDTIRVSVDSSGAQGNFDTNNSNGGPAISANGRYVAFSSDANNLVVADTNNVRDIFVRDIEANVTVRVSVDSSGAQANAISGYYSLAISGDGRYIAFSSAASNLVIGDSNGVSDIFVRDIVANTTTRVSVASDGVEGNHESGWPSISANGRYVVYESVANNLVSGDTNGEFDIFMRDTVTNTTTRVSVALSGVQANDRSDLPAISADGRYVAFTSEADNLINQDTNGGAVDVFVRDIVANTTTLVSVDSGGEQGNGGSFSAPNSISADGRYVAFYSNSTNLVSGDANGSVDVFMHDTITNMTTRVSVDSNGIEGNSESVWPSISADGRYVAFASSASNLVDEDTNGWNDVFIRNNQTNITTRVSIASDGGEGNSDSFYPSISTDGHFVAFDSYADNLVNGDTNGAKDVFVHENDGNNNHIISDATVRYSATLMSGWESPAFDDSSWLNVVAPSGGVCDPSLVTRISDSTALPVWGQNPQQFQTIYARKTFILQSPSTATIRTLVDDDFDLYVNGVLIRSDTNGQWSYFEDNISLQIGVNSIAIKASDTGGGCQSLAFDVTIGQVSSFMISGNAGIVGAVLSYTDGIQKTTLADANGNYSFSIPSGWSGTVTPSKAGYAFAPSNRVYTNVQSNQTNQNYVATQLKPPLILVHGFQGFPPGNSGYHCSDGIQEYNGTNSTLGSLPNWLLSDYEVWIAHLESTPESTPSLYANAECLRDQINTVAEQNPNNPITIVAHSMGGLVSRASLYYIRGDVKIDALYTLGSPHAGFPFDILQLIFANKQPAVYDMEETQMAVFNDTNENLEDVKYYFIGGDATPPGLGWLNFPFVGSNDGFVGKYNALGWDYPNKSFTSDWASPLSGQYWTNEVHISDWGNSYYSAPPGDLYSYSFECMKDLLKHLDPNPLFCQDATNASATDQALMAQSTPPLLSAFTELKNGHLNASQSISIPLQIDSNSASLFYLTWSGDSPTFTLTRPDTQVINPGYATSHPSEVTYEDFDGGAGAPPYAVYNFNTTQSGTWQLNIVAAAAIDYQAFAAFDSSRSLTAQTNADLYQIGDTATITANLVSSGIGLSGVTVTATLTRPDDVVDVVSLTDQGNGTYTNTYIIPDASGYLAIDITANGDDNGTPFTRQENLLVAIAPNDLQLTGTYDDQPRDDNSDSIYEYLDFMAEVDLAVPGEYAASAELYAGDQLLTQSGDFFQLVNGTQTVTLPFDGGAIQEAGLNGPYTVKNLYFTPIDTGITAASVENAWTTGAYSYTQFTDTTSPLVSSITRTNTNPTSAASVDFAVTFSEAVTGVDSGDFALTTTGVSGASVMGVNGSGAIYTVTVDTGSGSGTIRLDVTDNDSIVDGALYPLGAAGVGNGDFTNGEVYTIEEVVPTETPTDTPTPTFTPTSTPALITLILQPNGTTGIDSYIYSGSKNSNFGTAVDMGVGEDNDTNNRIAHSLIKFDLSSIPANATITSATLSLWTSADLSSNDRVIRAYRLKIPFNETQVTWTRAATGANWQTAGASGTNDRESTDIGSITILNNEALNLEKQILLTPAKIQELVNGTFVNNGFIIVANTGLNDRFNYQTSDSTSTTQRPKLVIQYTLASVPPTNTPTSTPIPTNTPSNTPTASNTPTNTLTNTLTPTFTPSSTPTFTYTPTNTHTLTPTKTPTFNPTLTYTPIPAVVRIGETKILATNNSGNGNRLTAQQVTLSQSATLQSLSFYVSIASGQLRLGIYNHAGTGPGTLVGGTAAFTPTAGWNTQPVLTPTLLPAGTYWLAFLPQNNSLTARMATTGAGRHYTYTFGALPGTYSSSPTSGVFHFSFYATLSTGAGP